MIENWRPITLLCCDYKILEKVFANRMKKVIGKLVKKDQKAYIEGRFIGDNARLMEDVIFECDNNESPGAIILIDQSKAFDRVEWEWLKQVMKRFNFGHRFINWILMLYQHAKSTIMTNGHFSETFSLGRGLRQGSPLSSLLYILQAEPFAEAIRKSENIKGIKINTNEEVRISAYADDTQIYIQDENSKTELDRILQLYSKASGAKINVQKTEGIPLNNFTEIEGIKWTIGPIKALGVPQGLIEDLGQFWDKILQRVKKHLELWSKRNLTMQGKVYVVKSMAISQVIYAGGLKVIPEKKLNEINKEIWKYLWNGKNESVKREICMYKLTEGGLGMPNLRNVIKTRHVMIVKRILSEGNEIWKTLPRKYFKSLDDMYNEEYFLLRASVPHNVIDNIQMPEFYKQCIKSWQEIGIQSKDTLTEENILTQKLWYNDRLRVNGEMLNNKSWAKAGITTIGDIIDSNGNTRSVNIRNIIRNSDVILYVEKIKAAIPKEWRNLLNNKEETIQHINKDNQRTVNEKVANANSKQIYDMLQGKKKRSRWETEWEVKYGPQQWDTVYKANRNKLADRRAIDLHWKTMNYGLNTEEKLRKMKLSDGKCVSCQIETETVEHLFFECELIDRIWSIVNKISKQIWNIDFVNERNVMLANINEDKPSAIGYIIQYIILSIKWIIWTKRNILKYDEKWTSGSICSLW